VNLRALVSELRAILGWTSLLPALGLPGFAVLSVLLWANHGNDPAIREAFQAFQLIMPLSAGLAAASLMSIEREDGFDELRRSYAEPSWKLPVIRSLEALLIPTLAALAGWAVYRWAGWPIDPQSMILTAVPATLFLTGLSLLVSNASGSYWAAAGVVMIYWFLELQTRGDLTKNFFLFNLVWPREDVSTSLNQLLINTLSSTFFLLNLATSYYRRRGTRHAHGLVIRRISFGRR